MLTVEVPRLPLSLIYYKITFGHWCIHVSTSHRLSELPCLFLKLNEGDPKAHEVVKLISMKCTALDFFDILQVLCVLHSTLRHAKRQELILNSFYFGMVWWS